MGTTHMSGALLFNLSNTSLISLAIFFLKKNHEFNEELSLELREAIAFPKVTFLASWLELTQFCPRPYFF